MNPHRFRDAGSSECPGRTDDTERLSGASHISALLEQIGPFLRHRCLASSERPLLFTLPFYAACQ